jgi:hypothetical protein
MLAILVHFGNGSALMTMPVRFGNACTFWQCLFILVMPLLFGYSGAFLQ